MIQESLFALDAGEPNDNSTRPEWLTDELVQTMLSKMTEKTRPQGVAGGKKIKYSPTQMETYMRCPYGWFLNYIAKTTPPKDARTFAGSNAHNLIELADKENLAAAEAKLEEIPEDKREWVWSMVERAYDQYSNPDNWPEHPRHQEVTMKLTLPSGHEIGGRADRVDLFPEGALVIDWKLSATTKPTTEEYRAKQMQRYLYPLMAAQTYKTKPLGMIYVSLTHTKHEGSLTQDVGLGGTMDYNWEQEAQQAIVRLEDGIAGIERGDWWRQGESCPRWCSCKVADEAQAKWTNPQPE